MFAPLPPDESERLLALRQYEVLDTAPEPEFDDLTHLAAAICAVPFSAIVLLDTDRAWSKSMSGPGQRETPRDLSFCAHAILGQDLLEIPDATADERFADNAFVTGEEHIRFYAGVPLITPEGQAVGALCVVDNVPRQLDETQRDALRRLARQTVALLEARPDATEKRESRHARRQAKRRKSVEDAARSRRDMDALLASEARYRRLFETAQDGILILDGLSGHIVDVNPFLCELLDFSPDYFLGKQLWEIGVFGDAAANQEAFRELLEAGYLRYDDLPLAHSRGGQVPVEFVSNVYLNGENQVIQCNIRDITAQKQADDTVRASAASLAKAQQLAQLGSWEQDLTEARDGKASLRWSDEIFRILGCEPGQIEVSNESFFKAVHPDDRERVKAIVASSVGGGHGYVMDYRVILPDGSERAVHSRAEVLRDGHDGSPLRIVGTAQDITIRRSDEAALRRSEERYRSLALATTQIVWVANADGIIEDMPAWRAYTGQGLDTMQHYDWMEAVHPDDREPTMEVWNRSVATESLYKTEYRVRGADGVYRLFAVCGVPILESDGRVREWVGTCTDIEEQRAAELNLERFFDLSLDMLCIAGLDGYFRRLNRAFLENFGFSEAEALAMPFVEWTHPEDVAGTESSVEQLVEGQAIIGFQNRYRTRDGGWRWLEWRSIAIQETGLIYAAARDITERKESEAALRNLSDELEARVDARTLELARANHDLQREVAERERAVSETRSRARQQEAVAELGRRALTNISLDTLLNGAAALVTATLGAEMCGILELLPNHELLRIRAGMGWQTPVVGRTVPGGAKSQSGYCLRSKVPTVVRDLRTETRFEPSQTMVENGVVSGVTVIIGGYSAPFGTIGVHSVQERDFSVDDVNFLQALSNILAASLEQRRVEASIRTLNEQLAESNELLRLENIERQMALGALKEVSEAAQEARKNAESANNAKSEFLSRMSHELRTPLNAILGFGQILKNEPLNELALESVGYIMSGGRHLLDLINEILDISRVEAGHIELSVEPIAVDELLREACALVRPLAAEREINFDDCLAALCSRYVMADRQRLKQVFINLLSNAIKYNRHGGKVEIHCEETPDGWTATSVRDSGAGIAPGDIAKLFQPFERLGATNSNIEGTGLGLALSERLVTIMGGRLSVDSVVGKGTVFTVHLPQAQSVEKQLEELPELIQRVESGREAGSPFTVLCIEDNPANLRLLEVICKSRPEVTQLVAMEGGLGVEMALLHEPQLILLDLNLPDIHGREVLARLRRSALTSEIPVVIISSDGEPRQQERLLNDGAAAYLTKPLDVALFLAVLDGYLRNSPRPAAGSEPGKELN